MCNYRKFIRLNLNIESIILVLLFLFFNNSFSFAQQSVSFFFTGSIQTWVVPPCVTSINVIAAGAKGGGNNGGNGAIVQGNVPVTPGQILQIRVGGMGNCPTGGWNGGGNGWTASPSNHLSCGGGGASDVRIPPYALNNRLIVGSGGGGRAGGSPYQVNGGAGGCATGLAGAGSPFTGTGGGGGSQFAGGNGGPPWAGGQWGQTGSLGQGGNGGYYINASGGGGGGGFYGGGGGGADNCCQNANGGGGGGGGSSLTPAAGTCNASSNIGNGYVTITFTTTPVIVTASNTGPYCTGQTIQLITNSPGTYVWTGPNNFYSTQQNPTIPNASLANAGVYNVTVTNNNCTSTATTTVVVNQGPIVSIINNTNSTVLNCNQLSINVTATGGGTYQWSGGLVPNSPFNTFTQPGTYTVTVTGANGCTATSSITITQDLTPPTVTITNNTNSTQLNCLQTSISVMAGTGVSYQWSGGSTPTTTKKTFRKLKKYINTLA